MDCSAAVLGESREEIGCVDMWIYDVGFVGRCPFYFARTTITATAAATLILRRHPFVQCLNLFTLPDPEPIVPAGIHISAPHQQILERRILKVFLPVDNLNTSLRHPSRQILHSICCSERPFPFLCELEMESLGLGGEGREGGVCGWDEGDGTIVCACPH